MSFDKKDPATWPGQAVKYYYNTGNHESCEAIIVAVYPNDRCNLHVYHPEGEKYLPKTAYSDSPEFDHWSWIT